MSTFNFRNVLIRWLALKVKEKEKIIDDEGYSTVTSCNEDLWEITDKMDLIPVI